MHLLLVFTWLGLEILLRKQAKSDKENFLMFMLLGQYRLWEMPMRCRSGIMRI